MLYQFFSPIKTLLLNEIATLKGVEWFNNQYDGTILNAPVCLVEFPEAVTPEEASKQMTRATITVRLHVVSRVITKVDNTVPDMAVIEHEELAVSIRDLLRGTELTNDADEEITSKLQWVRWQHFHKFQGWMVTTVDYTFRTTSF